MAPETATGPIHTADAIHVIGSGPSGLSLDTHEVLVGRPVTGCSVANLLVIDAAWETASNNEGPNMAVTQNWHATQPFVADGLERARTVCGEAACLLA